MLLISFTLPIRVVSEANTFEHWTKAHKRHKSQKRVVAYMMSDLSLYRDMPLIIKLIRISPRKLDYQENLPMAFKYVVDAIASILIPGKRAGRADDSSLFKWEYDQEKGAVRENKIRVEVYGEKCSSSPDDSVFGEYIPG